MVVALLRSSGTAKGLSRRTRGVLPSLLVVFFALGPPRHADEEVYGWGQPPLSIPGEGRQSWLYMPLISLGLRRAELSFDATPWSTGNRDPVPSLQQRFWEEHAEDVIEAYELHFSAPETTGQMMLLLGCPKRWRVACGADHVSQEDQEHVTPEHIETMLSVLLQRLATHAAEESPLGALS